MATAGTTLTVAILTGDLLTVANIGDCKAFLDTGREIVELTSSHRIEENAGQRYDSTDTVSSQLVLLC